MSLPSRSSRCVNLTGMFAAPTSCAPTVFDSSRLMMPQSRCTVMVSVLPAINMRSDLATCAAARGNAVAGGNIVAVRSLPHRGQCVSRHLREVVAAVDRRVLVHLHRHTGAPLLLATHLQPFLCGWARLHLDISLFSAAPRHLGAHDGASQRSSDARLLTLPCKLLHRYHL